MTPLPPDLFSPLVVLIFSLPFFLVTILFYAHDMDLDPDILGLLLSYFVI